jgi:aspartate beta-hydroxylase
LLAPDYTEAIRDKGRALLGLGRIEEAIASGTIAVDREPDDAAAQSALAASLMATGRFEEGFVRYRNAASLNVAFRAPLTQAMEEYARRNGEVSRAAKERLNRYIGAFVTNQDNARMGIYPGLRSTPFHDSVMLRGALELERNYLTIREEVGALTSDAFQAESEGLVGSGAWDVLLFYERGRKNEENCAKCPTISRIIEGHNTVRTQAGLLYVSKLNPQTHVRAHRGPTNMRVRCHLGIVVPDGDCGLKVDGHIRRWNEGHCLVFDDSFEHEAWNQTNKSRIVVIIDFWHPDLTPMEIAFLEGLHRYASFQALSLNRYWASTRESRANAQTLYD